MGDITGIEWTDHTFNPWWGCARVSSGCEHCYAETFAARFGVKWGVKAERRPSSEKVWSGPLRWDKAAEKAGVKARVFCSSMADVFEDRPELVEHRARLFALIARTPNLIWQLLTKRPENILRLVPESWLGRFPDNVWIGTTVEDQRRANERIPVLLAVPAVVRFLSCEPLIGPVDLDPGRCDVHGTQFARGGHCTECAANGYSSELSYGHWLDGIGWVIAGGESGAGARPMHPDWARALRDQCADSDVAFFFKQWGEHDMLGARHGKKATGSLLDGVPHKAFPDMDALS
jgi:protein gp37